MKPPKNFYSNLDRRKQGLPEVPEASAADAGKIIKVGESGAYELGEDENTIIIPNPDTTPSATLNALTIGSTTYKVNDARVTKLLGLRFTINNGGTYVTKMPIISFVNEYGEATQVPNYTMACDKPIQYGRLYLNGDAGVTTENLPAIFTVLFNTEFNIENFANIKLENSGLFAGDIAKNIKLEYSVNGDDWLEIFDKVSIDWTNTIHIYDMSTGEEITTKSPIPEPTAADAGKFLGVDNTGAWELDNVPSELPAVTSADAGKVLTVDSNGAWEVKDNLVIINGTITSTPKPTRATFNDSIGNICAKIKECIDNEIDVIIRLSNVSSLDVLTIYDFKVTTFVSKPTLNSAWCYAEVTRYIYDDGVYSCRLYFTSNETSTSLTIDNIKLS